MEEVVVMGMMIAVSRCHKGERERERVKVRERDERNDRQGEK